jgi:N-acetylneuraminate synthase
MTIYFLITARGGSKGLPGKNLRPLGGIPLVGRSALLGRQAGEALGLPFRVVCSTDNPAIASTARDWGAEVPFRRPARLATDKATSVEVILHAGQELRLADDDLLVLLQPTSPLASPEDVCGTVRLALSSGAPAVSVCRTEHPPAWQFRMGAENLLRPLLRRAWTDRRQDADPAYRLNGAVYAARMAQIRSLRGFIGSSSRGYEMPVERSTDVDTATDLTIAEAILSSHSVGRVAIAGRPVGPGHPCFIIAEAGVNHNGSLALARRLVDAAARAGADAVKFQTFRAERLATSAAPKAAYQKRTTGAHESQLMMLRRLELSEEHHRQLIAHCGRRGILFLSSPFDEESADLLDALGVPAFKVPSGEITNLPFLSHLGRKRKPVILSTGMSTLDEVRWAVETLRENGCSKLVLLHCVSDYPARPRDANLRAMRTLEAEFGTPVGFSDHTPGREVALAAAALGACIVEKHFTLDRALPGPDHQASVEPGELRALVEGIRTVESALGSGLKVPARAERGTAAVARKSLVASRDIPAGAVLTPILVAVRRPGTGMPPAALPTILGRRVRRALKAGHVLSWKDLE